MLCAAALSVAGGGGELQATLLIIPAQVRAASAAGGETLVVGTVAAPVSLQLLSLAPSTVWTLTALNGTDQFPVAIDGQLLSAGAAPLSDALDSVGAQQVKSTAPERQQFTPFAVGMYTALEDRGVCV